MTLPNLDTTNTYTTDSPTDNDGFVDFVSYRVLAPGGTNVFAIPLGTSIPMIWAFASFTGNTSGCNGMQYHSGNRNTWALTINENGTSTSSGNNGISPGVPAGVSEVLNVPSLGGSLYSGYDSTTGLIKYFARVKMGTYLAIGYGKNMDNVNMFAWMAGNTLAECQGLDLYSTGEHLPSTNQN